MTNMWSNLKQGAVNTWDNATSGAYWKEKGQNMAANTTSAEYWKEKGQNAKVNLQNAGQVAQQAAGAAHQKLGQSTAGRVALKTGELFAVGPKALGQKLAGSNEGAQEIKRSMEGTYQVLDQTTAGKIALKTGELFAIGPKWVGEQIGEWANEHPETAASLVQAIQGGLEIVLGMAIAGGLGWTGIGAVAGAYLVAHGLDTFAAGAMGVAKGETQRTLTNQGLTKVTGSQTAADWIEAGLSLLASWSGTKALEKSLEKQAASKALQMELEGAVTGERMQAPGKLVNCFPPNTLVGTESGLRPMSQIGAGERVWGYDFLNGVWQLCRVECRHDANYDGPLVTLHADVGQVTATAFHPFWVIQGDDLVSRPTPRHVGEDEDQGGSLPGRWVNSHDLREGDVLFLKGRGPVTLRRVVQRQEQTPVCNLTVEGLHTFAVGEMQILVHNTSGSLGSSKAVAEHLATDHPERFGRDVGQIEKQVDKVINSGVSQETKTGAVISHHNGITVIRRPDGTGTMVLDKNGNSYRTWLAQEGIK